MLCIRSVAAAAPDTPVVLDRLAAGIAASGIAAPALVVAFHDGVHDAATLHAALRRQFPRAPIIGGTSCQGVMTERGLHGPGSAGLLLIEDARGDYGVAAGPLGEDAEADAEALLHAALEQAGCPGELPELIWVVQAPGREEAVIAGLRRAVGQHCPIIGGTAAGRLGEGEDGCRQIGPDGALAGGLVVAALIPSGGVGLAFQGGYEPAGPSGTVTGVGFDIDGPGGVVTASAGRHILSIDGEPAARVYSRWLGDALDARLAAGGDILTESTMHPLAVEVVQAGGVPQYLLVHPKDISAEGGLTTFATVAQGSRIHVMRGERERLVERVGRVTAQAAARLPGGAGTLAGGFVICCAGCMLAVGERLDDMAQGVVRRMDGRPFLGCFTFGEQGEILGRNVHGNLMIAALALGR
ncbi:FIST signal transduction protein [Rhodovastum atsumiense]|uniref:Histidine kinase n=1 Tax=Rhodovastum atsumiense TaxID=504468 RepID=A0A5M6IR30_9PROT|nr:FIST N-terminal domain-containing protein [Rhodovastum atsumiense]KAA5610417.1 hypothetical protein F1189_19530 [Rhodovastum atsumiense]